MGLSRWSISRVARQGAAGGLLLVALAAILWGTTGTSLRLATGAAGALPLVVGASRMAVAAPLLGLSARLHDSPGSGRPRAFIAAGACMALYQVCYFSAVPLAGVAVTALLAICSAPILVAALARVALGERLTATRMTALGTGAVGAGLLVSGGRASWSSHFALGAALALGAGLSYALYAVLTKGALSRTSPLWLSARTFGVAAAVLAPTFLLLPSETIQAWSHNWPLLLYLGALPTALAYWLYTIGLQRIPATSAAIAGLMEPLTATVLGTVLFAERLPAVSVLGAALLVGAVVLASVQRMPGRVQSQ
jgi:DME family drug/metabolite transporter